MSTNSQAAITQDCYQKKKARNSHQNSYHSILLWQAKQPVPLLANTAVNTNWHHAFHALHFMFNTWVQEAAMYQAKLA